MGAPAAVGILSLISASNSIGLHPMRRFSVRSSARLVCRHRLVVEFNEHVGRRLDTQHDELPLLVVLVDRKANDKWLAGCCNAAYTG